jgi:NAD(P)-dependent dehydrogenase (short-subunit alcohol dehydrogenase family)
VPEVKFNAVEPGFTATDLTAAVGGGGRPAEESAEVVARMSTIGKDGPTGTFQETAGEIAW